MKKLEKMKKKELIEYITTIRPKAYAYDRVCEQLGIENNILGFVKKLTIPNVSKQRELLLAYERHCRIKTNTKEQEGDRMLIEDFLANNCG